MKDNSFIYRHPSDRNLFIYEGHYYNGMKIIRHRGPLIYNYLQRLDETIQNSLRKHPHVIAIRIDLKPPCEAADTPKHSDRFIFSRFIDSLKSKIKAKKVNTERRGCRFHDTTLNYVWTKEFSPENGNPHYHCILFFNQQTFRGLGDFNTNSQSLFSIIHSAWISAAGLEEGPATGLVSIPENAAYEIRRGERYDDLFYRVSYFAKLETKLFHQRSHNFGASRSPRT